MVGLGGDDRRWGRGGLGSAHTVRNGMGSRFSSIYIYSSEKALFSTLDSSVFIILGTIIIFILVGQNCFLLILTRWSAVRCCRLGEGREVGGRRGEGRGVVGGRRRGGGRGVVGAVG